MPLRDDIEETLRAWNQYETNRGASEIIDYDCHPTGTPVKPANSRLDVYRRLRALAVAAAEADEPMLTVRLTADLAYLRELLGQRTPLADYIRDTQGCGADGWPESYVTERGETARTHLAKLGIDWGTNTANELEEYEGRIATDDGPEVIREAVSELEPAVRQAADAWAPYELSIESANVDAYWAYWIDGAGTQARLRLNLRHARFTRVRARQFALHEVLGHALQSASYAQRCAAEDVSWARVLSVHTPYQVLLEGLAQALPLLVLPDDKSLAARVRLDHYFQLVRAEVHLAINEGTPVDECARHAKIRVPFWSDEDIGDLLTDRGNNPLLRSYLWAYPAGIDWFVSLVEQADASVIEELLHAAYRAPLTPAELATLWPAGPPIGGPGHAVRLRQPPVP